MLTTDEGWSAEAHIALMDKMNISKSILSITSPGTYLKISHDKLVNLLTQETNDDTAEICRQYPVRFGFFAALPPPGVELPLKEIDRALDTLGALGFAIMTNAPAHYPRDAELNEVFAKVNARKAVIIIHPTGCCTRGHADVPKASGQVPFPYDGILFRHHSRGVEPHLIWHRGEVSKSNFLISHRGATISSLVEHFAAFSSSGLLRADSISSS